jgi:hypothetical protein
MAATFGGLTAAGVAASHPAVSLAAAMGIALVASYYRQSLRAAPIALGLIAIVWFVGQVADASVAVAETQILAAGAIVGAGMFSLEKISLDRWHLLQTTLSGIAAAGVGWWCGTRLLGGVPVEPLQAASLAAIFGLITGLVMVVASLRYHTVERIPSPARIRVTLKPEYQTACIKAWRIDRDLEKSAPDADSRDGLGELAAWIYKLQWSMQTLDREIEAVSDIGLQARIVKAYEEAEASTDDFIRERRIATAQHLEQLSQHRDDLVLERQRLGALVEYAAAYQEEARAGLVLARLQPGEHTPARLDEVLQKLRSHSNAKDVQRRTARELARLTVT